ncbi:MAG: ABC transporter substrate-binding protein, partial [Spirochaetota bacterium]
MKNRLLLVILVLLLTPFLAFAGGEQEEAAEAPGVSEQVPSEFNEAPMLAAMVEAGELPPVDERLPEVPMVVEPHESIGQYGGQLVRGHFPVPSEGNLAVTPDGQSTIPNFLESFEFNDDGTVFTMHIRRGLKWSDGEPVTADDYLFKYYDMDLNETLNPVEPNWAKVGGEFIEMVKVDDYTVELQFARPFYAVIHKMNLIGQRFFFGPEPRHWLGEYHIDYNDDADAVAQEAGFEEWWQYFSQVADIEDPENNYTGEKLGRPALTMWIFKEETPTAYIYERNPYYFKVDTAGNQLPYIDTHIHQKVEDDEVRLLKTLNGELDFVGWGTSVENFPEMKRNEAAGGYETWLVPNVWGAAPGLSINQTYNGDNAEVVAPLLRDIRFRQALSLAIDRDEINEIAALGQGTPRQAAVHPDTAGYDEQWAEAFAEYAPERANALLDEMGLTERGSNGMRLDPEGREFTLNIPVLPERPWNTA